MSERFRDHPVLTFVMFVVVLSACPPTAMFWLAPAMLVYGAVIYPEGSFYHDPAVRDATIFLALLPITFAWGIVAGCYLARHEPFRSIGRLG